MILNSLNTCFATPLFYKYYINIVFQSVMIRVKATALEERQKIAWSVMKDMSWMKVKDVKVDCRLCCIFQ